MSIEVIFNYAEPPGLPAYFRVSWPAGWPLPRVGEEISWEDPHILGHVTAVQYTKEHEDYPAHDNPGGYYYEVQVVVR